MSMKDRIRIQDVETLSARWGVLKKTTFQYQRGDGTWQTHVRETYDRGNGATILLYNLERRTVVLIRQFRYPAFAVGDDGMLIETPAGLLDNAGPEVRIRAEAEEETGFRVRDVRCIFEAYMSPGSVTEKLFFFIGQYDHGDKVSEGGGLDSEGEDIDVLEVDFEDALAMIDRGDLRDAKSIMLLQYAALHLFPARTGA